MRTRNEEMEINLLTLFEVLCKKIAIILVVGIVCGLLGFGWAYSASNPVENYTATVSVFVTSEVNHPETNAPTSYSSATGKVYADTCAWVLKSNAMLGEILDETGLPYSTSELSGMIDAVAVKDISALDISVKAADAKEVESIAQAILKLLPARLNALGGDIAIGISNYSLSSVQKVTEGGIDMKKPAIGALLGVFLAAALIVVKFLVSGQLIWKAAELNELYPQLPLLAAVSHKSAKGKNKDEEYRFAAANLVAQTSESTRVFGLTGVKEISRESVDKLLEAFAHFGKKAGFVDAKAMSLNELERAISDAKATCDYVLAELPPIGLKADAMPAAKLVDTLVLVIKEQQCTVEETDTCIERLQRTGAEILGFIAE
ncbi:MAG: hypothetical protein IJB09_00180 [Oscillospiraceae bacterium]|nr:hypothetical protein [Oscillospiraceae bacterium]